MNEKLAVALTIAGSDPSGGAGIQVDLKTFSSFRVYGQSVITSLTAQNNSAVTSIHNLPPKFIGEQFDSLYNDLGFNAVKIGMLSNKSIIQEVINKINEYKIKKIVLDPVIVSSSGTSLLKDNAVELLKNELIPKSYILTPNILEAAALTGIIINNLSSMKQSAIKLKELGCRYVIIKGGHGYDPDYSTDLLYDGKEFKQFKAKRIHTVNTHGTGCTFSAAICANLARGIGTSEAVKASKKYITKALSSSLGIKKRERRLIHYWNIK
jgi:hydroxymethylpyrimidine/phosphomethylpyrimidine kinase